MNNKTKGTKKQAKKEFLTMKDEKILYNKINRIFILSIIGIIFSIISGAYDYLYKTGLWNYVLDIILFGFSFTFLLKTIQMKNYEINKYIDRHNKK